MDKETKRAYERTGNTLKCRLSKKEYALLLAGMEKGGWTNMSAYAKSKIFGEDEDKEYSKLKSAGRKSDIVSVLIANANRMSDQIEYLNHRYWAELDRLTSKEGWKGNEEDRVKTASILRKYAEDIQMRTTEVRNDLEEAIRMIGIRYKRAKKEDIRYAPDWVVEKAVNEWGAGLSPEAAEGARRRMEAIEKERKEAAEKERKNIRRLVGANRRDEKKK